MRFRLPFFKKKGAPSLRFSALEKMLLQRLVDDHSLWEIASELGVSEPFLREQLNLLQQKMKVSSEAAMILYAVRHGLVRV